MFKLKMKSKSDDAGRPSSMRKFLQRASSADPKPAKKDDAAHRYARSATTTSTMLSDDNEVSYYSQESSMSGELLYSGRSVASSTTGSRFSQRVPSQMSTTSSADNLRSTALDTLNEHEETASVDIYGFHNGSSDGHSETDGMRAELAAMKEEMRSIKREMMNEMHQTRYDLLKEVTMLKGTILQLVHTLQSGGIKLDGSSNGEQAPAELSSNEKELLARRPTTTVASKATKDRITAAREDLVPPVMRGTSGRMTQLSPVDDSALSTPLTQTQIDEMFPLVDSSADVHVQSQILETGSREWVFDRVQDWLDSQFNVGTDTVMAMVGDAGSGKTVAAAAVSFRHSGHVVANHFCKFDKKAKSSPRNTVLSVVNQLTTTLPSFKAQLARLNLRYVLEETDALVLARKILVDPLNALEEPLTPKFMVFDGLDQCHLPVEGHNELLEFLSIIIPECPTWLGFLITSKPSPALAAQLPVTSVLDFSAKNPRYLDDTVFLVSDILQNFDADDVEDAKFILQEKSRGNYAYLEFTKQALSHPAMNSEDPAHSPSSNTIPVDVLHDLPESIYEIYAEIFEEKFGQGRNRLWRKAQPVLQLVVAAASGPYALITEQSVLDTLQYSKDDVRMLRRAFVDIVSIRHGAYYIVSSSLYDWLSDPQRSAEQFHVDAATSIKMLKGFLRGERPATTPSTKSSQRVRIGGSASPTTSSSSLDSTSSLDRVTATHQASVPTKRYEPNLHVQKQPVGILKRSKA